jgi:hypothetical protein
MGPQAQTRQANGETALCLERVQSAHGVQMVLSDKFESIFKGNDNGGIHPRLWSASQFIEELPI